MSVRTLFVVAIGLLPLFSGSARASADIPGIEARLKIAADSLTPESTGGNPQRALRALADAMALAAPDTRFPTEFKQKISEAGQQGEMGPLAESVRGAYLVVSSGKEFRMPPANLSQIAGEIRKSIDRARAALKQGDLDSGTRAMLDAAMMICTPVQRPPDR